MSLRFDLYKQQSLKMQLWYWIIRAPQAPNVLIDIDLADVFANTDMW